MELAKIAERSPKPLVAFAMATQNLNDYGLEFKARCRLPFLESAQNSVRALAHLGNYSSALKRMRGDEINCRLRAAADDRREGNSFAN